MLLQYMQLTVMLCVGCTLAMASKAGSQSGNEDEGSRGKLELKDWKAVEGGGEV